MIFSFLKGLCEGHPGLSRASLKRIQNDFKIGEEFVTTENLFEKVLLYVSNGSLSEKLLNDSRCFVSPKRLADTLDVDLDVVYQLIEMMLLKSANYSGII